MILRSRPHVGLPAWAGAAWLLLSAGPLPAQVSVTASVSPNGALYHYDYSITNGTPFDLADVSLSVLPEPGVVQDLTAPGGFLASYDPGLGLVDFLGDTQDFTAGETFSGFAFDSPVPSRPTTFTSLDVQGNATTGATVGPTAIPEPGALGLCALAIPGLIVLGLRRKVAAPARPVSATKGEHCHEP